MRLNNSPLPEFFLGFYNAKIVPFYHSSQVKAINLKNMVNGFEWRQGGLSLFANVIVGNIMSYCRDSGYKLRQPIYYLMSHSGVS
jgi:hypothetical protein